MYTEIRLSTLKPEDFNKPFPLIPIKFFLCNSNVVVFQLIIDEETVVAEMRFKISPTKHNASSELISFCVADRLQQNHIDSFYNFAENVMNSYMVYRRAFERNKNESNLQYTFYCDVPEDVYKSSILKKHFDCMHKDGDTIYCQ